MAAWLIKSLLSLKLPLRPHLPRFLSQRCLHLHQLLPNRRPGLQPHPSCLGHRLQVNRRPNPPPLHLNSNNQPPLPPLPQHLHRQAKNQSQSLNPPDGKSPRQSSLTHGNPNLHTRHLLWISPQRNPSLNLQLQLSHPKNPKSLLKHPLLPLNPLQRSHRPRWSLLNPPLLHCPPPH